MTDSHLSWYQTVLYSELDEEEPTQVKIENTVIAVCKVGSDVYAVNDICTHEHAFLSDGMIEDGCIECPLHQAMFDIKTGKAVSPPASVDLVTYQTRIEDGVVWVGI